jgi:hypothetical protein
VAEDDVDAAAIASVAAQIEPDAAEKAEKAETSGKGKAHQGAR